MAAVLDDGGASDWEMPTEAPAIAPNAPAGGVTPGQARYYSKGIYDQNGMYTPKPLPGAHGEMADDWETPEEPPAPQREATFPWETTAEQPPVVASAAAQSAVGSVGQTLKGIGAAGAAAGTAFSQAQLDVMDRIDRGEHVRPVDDPMGYGDMTPEQRQAFRQQVQSPLERAAIPSPVKESPLYQAGQAVEEYGQRTFPLTPEEKASFEGKVGSIAGGMAIPMVGALTLGPAGVLFGAGQMGFASAGATFDQAVEKGASEKDALKAAGLSGAVGATLGSLPLGVVLAPIKQAAPGLLGWVAAKLAQAGVNGLTFATVGEAQEWIDQQIAKAFYDPSAEYTPDVSRLLASALVGGAFGTMHPLHGPQTEEGGKKAADIDQKAAAADPAPTEGQKAAGNYKKGHVDFQGMDVTIENPRGSERSGVDPDGKPWFVTMPDHYGYIRGTEGVDGDHHDVYVGPNPESDRAFVVDQVDADTGKFDEHKTMLGYSDRDSAIAAYNKAFSDGRGLERIGSVTEMSVPAFKDWVKSADASKPAAETAPADRGVPVAAPSSHVAALDKILGTATATDERLSGETDKQFAKRVVDQRPIPDRLPEQHDLYFNADPHTLTIPIDDLVSTKGAEENVQGGENGAKRMAAAAAGELSRRGPITVMPRADGKWDVVDGNGTLTSVKKYGWNALPANPAIDLSPGVKALGVDASDAMKKTWAAESPIKTVDDLFARAKENQDVLRQIARSITEDTGVEFRDPGVKGRPRVLEKIEGGKAPGRINDVVRGGFVVDTPAQAEEVVRRLAEHLPVVDEGWAVTPVGYFDRKVLLRFSNGQVGEIQLWHPDLLRAKADKGHRLYVERRKLPNDAPRAAELDEEMQRVYGEALAAADPAWKSLLSGEGGSPGNLAENASAGSTRPSIPASPELTERQAPSVNVQAAPGVQTSGSPSSVPNVTGRVAIDHNIVPIGEIVQGIPPHRVTSADGSTVKVLPVVVDAYDLKTSRDAGYDKALQPRQRDRAASQSQLREITSNLDPERLGYSAESDRGAPIVGPDGMVESGNGRILALRRVYAQGGDAAQRYRDWLAQQGVDVSRYRQPVLVRQRLTPMDADQRSAFTLAANQAATLGMSATERAIADARGLDSHALDLIVNPNDLGAVANRGFVRRFVASLPQTEQGGMVDAKGGLSSDGLARVRNAVLARAYGDASVISRIAESTNDEVKSISSALVAAAPEWARLRAAVESGRVRADLDVTPELIEAVSRTADIRGRGDKLDGYLAQQDAFDRLPALTEGFMRMFYDPRGRRAAGARDITDALRFYAQEAAKVTADTGLNLGMVPVEPRAITDLALRRREREQEVSDRGRAGAGPRGAPAGGQEGGFWLSPRGEGAPLGGHEFAPQEEGIAAGPPRAQRPGSVDDLIRNAVDAVSRAQRPMPGMDDLFGGGDRGPEGRPVRTGAQAVPGAKPAGRPRPTPAVKPEQLSLFGGTAGERPTPGGNAGAPSGNAAPPVPRPSEGVTKPPSRGGGIGPTRLGTPAVAGLKDAETKIAERSRQNYRITDDDEIGTGGPKQKVRANLDAIRLLRTIEDEGRQPTPEEKAKLVKYTGWGAFAQDVFAAHKSEWRSERDELRALMTDREYEDAKASTLNAHFTSPDVIRGMWSALDRLGFKGGLALEPAAGIGHFIGLTPDKVAPKTAWTAVELDSISGRITKALYGGAEVNVHGFEELKRPSNYYDLAVSNVPFGQYHINEKPYGSFPIHDFFFVKSLDKVRPGGVVAFITSRYTMDRVDPATRNLLSKTADLVGAIRLPGGNKGAFAKNAGTDVTTDALFLRKKIPGEAPFPGSDWSDLKEVQTPEGPTRINEYFADRPHMMLGEMRLQGTQYRANEPVLIGDSEGLDRKIAAAAQNMPADALTPISDAATLTPVRTEPADGLKDGALFVRDGAVFRREQGVGREQQVSPEDRERITHFVGMRDTINDLLKSQLEGGDSDAHRARLRDAYDRFVDKYGPINKEVRTVTSRLNKAGDPVVISRYPNRTAFMGDPDAWKVAAIENYDAETGKATRAAIQTRDVIDAPREREINSASDALAASLDQKGGVDLDHIADSLGVDSQDEAAGILGDLVYRNPNGRQWEPTDKYLSGDVVGKLEEARAIAKDDPNYLRNVSALEKVQPTPLTAADITAQYGAPWVPAEVYRDFLTHALGGQNVKVVRTPITGEFRVNLSSMSLDGRAKYGTSRVSADTIAESALNNRQVSVYDTDREGKRTFNQNATEEARVKVDLLKEAFTGNPETGAPSWAFEDPDRAKLLEGIYNRTFNNLVPRKFDGTHLTLPGLNPDFATRQHRRDAVWRMVQNGNTLLAHAVGSGKTATMIAGGMEMKRLGLINKPAYTIPNHMLEQFSREFLQAYPNAKILVAEKEEMSRENRKAFMAKVASNDWDGVIITHDAFGRINMSQDFRRQHIQDQLDELSRVIQAEKAEAGDKAPSVKDLERAKKKLAQKLVDLMNEERKDAGTSFEESGIDHLFVDEAHLFKNLSFITRMQRVKGLSQGDSQRAEDLFLKIRYLEQKRPGRSAVFATGTPISNTMAEMWTMQRYLQLDALRERGLDNFDAWASTFGRVTDNMELSADGRTFKQVSSFSKFVNVPELISLYSEVADTKTADMLNLPRPEVKTRSGAPGIEIVKAQPSTQEEEHIHRLVALAESLKGARPKVGEPNMLSVVTEGRKVATDGRLISGDFDFNPEGKIAKAVDNIHRIWKEGKDPASGQMVFLDLGTPKSGARTPVQEAGADPAQAGEQRTDLYADLKRRLVDRGIPVKDIAFIHDATDDAKKAKLFSRVRSGDIRVLIGSTGKMGMGTNVQDRLIAMHHLDAPWKPAEVEQRDGRIVRQGNKNPAVQVYRYVTEKSFDAFMWQKLDTKSKFIGQVLSGAKGSRHAEDIDNPLPEASEMKAAASGDPRILEHAELDRQVRALTAQRRAFDSTKSRATWETQSARSRIGTYEKALPAAAEDAARITDIAGAKFAVELGDSTITDRREAGVAILDNLRKLDPRTFYTPKVVNIGRLGGLDMAAKLQSTYSSDGPHLKADLLLKGTGSYGGASDIVINEHTDPFGLIRRYENILAQVRAHPERIRNEIANEWKNVESLEKTATATWPREMEYKQAIDKLSTLTASLKEKKPDLLTPQPEVKAFTTDTKGRVHFIEPAAARRPEERIEPSFKPTREDRVFRIAPETDAIISDKYFDHENEIGDAVTKIGVRMAPQAQIRGTTGLRQYGDKIWGAFINTPQFPQMIAWSLEKGSPREIAQTVRHEVIHHLRQAGLIRPDEWRELQHAAIAKDWLGQYNIKSRYPEFSLDHQVEEAVAEHFAHWRADPEIEKGGLIRTAFARLGFFLRQVAAAVRKAMGMNATPNDIFTRIEAGEVGRRQAEQSAVHGYHPEEVPPAQTPGEDARLRRTAQRAAARQAGQQLTPWQRVTEASDAFRQKASDAMVKLGGDELVRDMQMHVSPMTARDAPVEARATSKDFANASRRLRHEWNQVDKYLVDHFDHDARRRMWEAADEESVALQQGLPTAGIGLSRLSAEERAVVQNLQARAQASFNRAVQLGAVQGPGLPSYAPRKLVQMSQGKATRGIGPTAEVVRDIRTLALATAETERANAGRELIDHLIQVGNRAGNPIVRVGGHAGGRRSLGVESLVANVIDKIGTNLSTTAPGFRHRAYLTTAETEVAAKRAPDTSNQPEWKTIAHPAFLRWRPRMVEDAATGKTVPMMDQNNQMVFDKVPIEIRKDWEGPLRAVLANEPGKIYKAYMALKGKVMSLIMFSPLIHNQVEWGRALPSAPGKVATFQIYFEGNAVKNDPAQMREAMSGGMAPIGGHGFMQDLTSIAEAPTLRPGQTLTAKGLGYAAEGLGYATLKKLYDPRTGADEVRRAVDTASNFWRNTLLWDRIGDLQAGLWSHFKEHLVDKGHDPRAANIVAAHFANRYAGALPVEAMSGVARGIANVLLFSRSFTLGNIGAYKDALLGLPRDAQALIQQRVGLDALQKAQSYAKRKTMAMLAVDAGMFYAGLSAIQSSINVMGTGHTVGTLGGMIAGGALGGPGGRYGRLAAAVGLGAAGYGLANLLGAAPGAKSLADEAEAYWKRFTDLMQRTWQHPGSVIGNPFKAILSLSSTAEHEPGKESRILIGYQPDGTGIYARLAPGKVTEELIGYMTELNDMLHRKLSTVARPVDQILRNDKGYGRKVYDPHVDTPADLGKIIANVAGLLVTSQLPTDVFMGAKDWLRGGVGSETSGMKAVAPLLGTTVSKGYPGGPASGFAHDEQERINYRRQQAMPGIRDQIKNGDLSGAVEKMSELGMDKNQITQTIRGTLAPAQKLTPGRIMSLERQATPEERERIRRAIENIPQRQRGGRVARRERVAAIIERHGVA